MRRLALLTAAAMVAAGCASPPEPTGEVVRRASESASAAPSPSVSAAGGRGAAPSEEGTAEPDPGGEPRPAATGDGGAPSPAASPTGSQAVAAVRPLPPVGQYRFRVTGERHWTGALGDRRDPPVPQQAHEDVFDRGGGGFLIRNVLDQDNQQELSIQMAGEDVHVVRQVVLDDASGIAVRQVIEPQPFMLLGRQPLRVGSAWPIDWRDPETGIEAQGEGRVVRRELVRTPVAEAEALVIEVEQLFRGTATGRVLLTIWLDTATGLHLRRSNHTDIETAAGRTVSVLDYLLEEAQ